MLHLINIEKWIKDTTTQAAPHNSHIALWQPANLALNLVNNRPSGSCASRIPNKKRTVERLLLSLLQQVKEIMELCELKLLVLLPTMCGTLYTGLHDVATVSIAIYSPFSHIKHIGMFKENQALA
jgi:hypothetical protein